MKVKDGMGESNNGKGRCEPTAVLKKTSKSKRRRQSKAEVMAQLGLTKVKGAVSGRAYYE